MNRVLDRGMIHDALTAVGELLAAQGEREAIVIAGGASLSLLGIVERTTTDVDVIARVRKEGNGSPRLRKAEPLPSSLERAVRTVARDFGLDETWLNTGVGKQWSQGLPPGLTGELIWHNYGGGLEVGLVGRRGLIALKLFAAVDRGADSVHFQDLLRLAPSDAELTEARTWVLTQDASERWPQLVDEVVADARRHR